MLLVVMVILCSPLLKWDFERISLELIGGDFAGYWASGRLLLQGKNPYSVEDLRAIQQSLNLPQKEFVLIYNPPWVLTFLLPFSILDFSLSKVIWLLCLLFLILYCAERLWIILGGHHDARIWSLLLVVTFTPTFIAFKLGQIVPFMLLGLVGFLHFARRRQWWLAGIMTVFVAIKPHVIFLFWCAMVLWAVKKRLWQILLGSAFGLVCVTFPTLFFNANVFSQYFSDIVMKHHISYWATPTFGTYLRLLFGIEKEWVIYMPALAGLIWFISYWRVRRDSWIWQKDLHLLIIISLISNCYSWQFDYLLILPTVMQAAIWIRQEPGVRNKVLMVLFYIMINVAAIVFTYFPFPFLFLGMPFALLINYILVKRQVVSNLTGG